MDRDYQYIRSRGLQPKLVNRRYLNIRLNELKSEYKWLRGLMGILVNSNTRIIVQGITGREGAFHTKLMLEYGSKIVAGTSPGKKGTYVHGVPVYNSIDEAIREQGAIDASIIFVPAKFAADAVYEAIDAGLKLVVVITEGIPVHDEVKFVNYARKKGVVIVGPNTPGVMTVGECKMGIMPAHVFKPGRIGLVSRSGTLTYEIARELGKNTEKEYQP